MAAEPRTKTETMRYYAVAARWRLRALSVMWSARGLWQEPGHFYSPVPSSLDLERFRNEVDDLLASTDLPGIDVRADEQLAMLDQLEPHHDPGYFARAVAPTSSRFRASNEYFRYGDAVFYRAMLAHTRPGRIVEIGSGYSTAIALDALDDFGIDAHLTLVEPYTERLESLVSTADLARVELHRAEVQSVDVGVFDALQSGDILFVDSTHVTRLGSDVNRIIFQILGRLAPGVWIHFHDVFYPFEYPLEWAEEFRAWNEAYLLRAFLQYNSSFRIALWVSYLALHHPEEIRTRFAPVLDDPLGTSSIWLRKES